MTINVETQNPYKILIKNNQNNPFFGFREFLDSIGSYEKIAVICDDKVKALYLRKFINEIKADKNLYVFDFKNGEKHKTLKTVNRAYDFLSRNLFDRKDLIIALGGGVTGDVAGFVAATYLRGIDYIQVPTTLLSMTDSSVGGKTGVDLKTGKNMVGAFYQPRGVFIDVCTLKTLDDVQIKSGLGEIIKYGAIANEEIFTELKGGFDLSTAESIINKCLLIKKEIVEKDEKDLGVRQALNFGHTLGHAVEKACKYKLSHGQCVVIGMVMITKWAEANGYMESGLSEKIKNLAERLNIQTEYKADYHLICDIAARDKKVKGNQITVVLLEKIGKFKLLKIDFGELRKSSNF